MKGTGAHITFWATIGTAGTLICGLPQSVAKSEQSTPIYFQSEALPQAEKRIAVHLASRFQSKSITITPRLIEDVTIRNMCKLRKYAADETQQDTDQSASRQDEDDRSHPAELKVTPSIQAIMNKVRPKQITGIINVQGKEYEFGSGGRGQSIPYGDYLITPDALGSWGSKHGAIGVANGTIPDPKLHRDRSGIELHAATNADLKTDGCISIRKDQWPAFRQQVLAMVKEDKRVYLHVSDQGASVSTEPFEFLGGPISEPTFQDVLDLMQEPVLDPAETKPSRNRCCRSERVKKRHTHAVAQKVHFHGHIANRRRRASSSLS